MSKLEFGTCARQQYATSSLSLSFSLVFASASVKSKFNLNSNLKLKLSERRRTSFVLYRTSFVFCIETNFNLKFESHAVVQSQLFFETQFFAIRLKIMRVCRLRCVCFVAAVRENRTEFLVAFSKTHNKQIDKEERGKRVKKKKKCSTTEYNENGALKA